MRNNWDYVNNNIIKIPGRIVKRLAVTFFQCNQSVAPSCSNNNKRIKKKKKLKTAFFQYRAFVLINLFLCSESKKCSLIKNSGV